MKIACMTSIRLLKQFKLFCPWMLFCICAVLLCSCADRGDPTVAIAMDGPALVVRGDYEGLPLTGEMDRTAMAGIGELTLSSADEASFFSCHAKFNAQPTDKGRVVGFMDCGPDGILAVMLRNLGPDQGVGLAHAATPEKMLIFFYHPSAEEAERRLPGILADIKSIRDGTPKNEQETDEEQQTEE